MEVVGIYSQFHQSLLSFIRSRIRSREDAEDILQNVFIKISQHVNSLSDSDKLQSWIFTITRNAITDYYRLNAAKKNVPIEDYIHANITEDLQRDATHGLDQCVSNMIELLPPDYRNIIIDSEIKGIKQKDLADKYGMAYPSVRSKVQRGRERLKQLFYNCCHIETNRLGNVIETHRRDNCGEECQPGCKSNE